MSSKSAAQRSSPTKRSDNRQRPQPIQRQALGGGTPNPAEMQKRLGNQGTQTWLAEQRIQPKLTIGQPGDQYEQEADRTADKVMRMSDPEMLSDEETKHQTKPQLSVLQRSNLSTTTESRSIQRLCANCEEEFGGQSEQKLQRNEKDEQTPHVTQGVEANINALDGKGSPLPDSTRNYFEPRFGADFSQVRVHTGTQASETAKSLNAKAFTVDNNIVFGQGQFAPNSHEGQKLIGHELTHTIQQGMASTGLGRQQHNIGNISRSMSVLVQRSWTGDRINWVRTATHEDNWASADPPGAYYVLNGLSMDDMVRILRALTPTERKKISDNLDEHAAGFDRSRLQLALTNAMVPTTDKAFRERSENLLWAIRSGNYANPSDGAFFLLAASKGTQRDQLIAALNRDALDALIAHRDEADGISGGAEVMSTINRKRGGIGATSREQRLIDLVDGNDWQAFFAEFNGMNEIDQLRFLRGNFGAVARIRNHIGSAEWGGDRDRMRYLLERVTTTASANLYVDSSIQKYIWQPKYRVENTNEYSRFIRFGDAFDAEIDINTIADGKLSEGAAEKQFQEAQPGPGGFLWPSNRNRSTLPVLWQVKQDVRKEMEALLFDPVLKAGIMVVQYILNVVFPFVQGSAIRSLSTLRRASVFGRWMQGSKVLRAPKTMTDAEAFTQARNARNTMVDAYNQMSKAEREKIATVTGGVNVETGQVAGGYNTAGACAEDMVVARLGGDASKVRFSEAIRPRTGQQVPVCLGCQGKYLKPQFAEGAIFK